MSMPSDSPEQAQIRAVLQAWAAATREGRKDDILANHADDVLIYDVLPPLKYTGAAAYRESWDDWQPDAAGECLFGLEDLAITVGGDVAYASAFIRCGGATADGRLFEDLVRATFCLNKRQDRWLVCHQHISKPFAFRKI